MKQQTKTDERTTAVAEASSGLFGSSGGAHANDETSMGAMVFPAAPAAGPGAQREPVEGHNRFATGELAMACSHYELGVISSVREFRRGSRRSPKVVLETSRGRVLIKRRSVGQDTAQHVAFSHAVQERLRERSFPLARLIRSREGRASLTIEGQVYEVFEFINGARYDRSEGQTADAGRTLAYFHRLLAGYAPPGRSGDGSFHANVMVPQVLHGMAGSLGRPELGPVCERLASVYERASARSREFGVASWPRQVVHCDFHPGNLVFGGGMVRALVDFDASRVGPRVLDIANGALQFSVTRSGLDPSEWPVELDEGRLGAFLRAYDAVEGCILSQAELRALPWLMIEALIAEAAMPIAATGRFGSIDGASFLEMVERKTSWLLDHHETVVRL
ncbi:MAG: phosphotransferase [Planctomycetota bacterium]